jgi:hypothetical protein
MRGPSSRNYIDHGKKRKLSGASHIRIPGTVNKFLLLLSFMHLARRAHLVSFCPRVDE